ncbi:MAG TPA: cation-transporting P-type ATPase [Corynebacterium glutamicum]|nr:cation-transporting P-type ATPase [Corynebacterium glutamicum]
MSSPLPAAVTSKPAHALSSDEVLENLGVQDTGLTSAEATQRLEANGRNELPQTPPETVWQRLFRQVNDPMIYVLIAAAVLTAFLGHWTDTIVIGAVVIINMMVGFIQEGKAADALASIRNMLSPESAALRDGVFHKIDAAELVVGDVVKLSAGDKVPADLRMLAATNLHIEESALTGEAEAVVKGTDPVEADAGIGDRTSMAFSGTLVLTGSGTGVVTATGAGTEIGHITTMLADVNSVDTPLTRSMKKFSSTLAIVCVFLAILMLVVAGLVHHTPLEELILSAIGFAVAAIPEGLPAVIAITLALGVQKMAARNAITRRLNSVETLGSVTTICTDKTGTLTRNEMTVRAIATGTSLYDVSGAGYEPLGEIRLKDGEQVSKQDFPDLHAMALVAANVNDAEIYQEDGMWKLSGEPTDGGIRAFAMKTNAEILTRTAEVPFDSAYKYMATLHTIDGANTMLVKGAPDRLLDRSAQQRNGEPLDRPYWEQLIEDLASQGLRVLAAAYKELPHGTSTITPEDVDQGELTFLGLYGIMDPPREEVIEAMKVVQSAGVRVRMITGDHSSTARAIAREVGIRGQNVLTGAEITAATDEELQGLVDNADLFVRTSPEHKLRVVRALQANGEVASMTGDGVNDAPALKQADVGVAMGIKGTEATKDAADIVLADDNFATIAGAVEMGRTIYDNLRKAVVFMLPTNGAQGLVIFIAMLLGWELPITALQVLWINLITAITLSLALSFEPAEPGIMNRKPRNPKSGLIDAPSVLRIVYVSLLLGGATFWAFLGARDAGIDIDTARTIAVTTLAVSQVFYLLSSRYFEVSALRKELFTTNPISWLCIALMLILQLAFVYLPFMQSTFDTAALALNDWVMPLVFGVVVFAVVETEKFVRRLKAS